MDSQANPQRFNNILEAIEDGLEEQKRLTALSGILHALQREKLLRGDALVMSPMMNHYVTHGMISKVSLQDIFEVYRKNNLDTELLERVCKIFNQPIPN